MAAALDDLKGAKRPINANMIKTAAKTALKYSSDYKMAVHAIESFIRKAESMDKLPGIYVLDAVCRQPKSDMFKNRFSIRLKETVKIVADHVSPEDRPSLLRLLDEWDRRSLFEIGENFSAIANSRGGGASSSSSSSSSRHHHSSSLHASSTSEGRSESRDSRKRKHETDNTSASTTTGPTSNNDVFETMITDNNEGETSESNLLGKSSAAAPSTQINFFIHDQPTGSRGRLCPFADSCIFGDKCRFSHSDVIGFQPSYPFVNRKGYTYATL